MEQTGSGPRNGSIHSGITLSHIYGLGVRIQDYIWVLASYYSVNNYYNRLYFIYPFTIPNTGGVWCRTSMSH